MLTSLQLLRRIVRQQTTSIDRKVTNIHGAALPTVTGITKSTDISWLRLVVPGTELIDLDEFYQRYFLDETHPFHYFDAPNGVLSVTDGQAGVKLYRATLTLTQSQSITLGVVVGGQAGQAAVYVDGVLQRTGVGTLELTRQLPGGTHLLEIMTVATDITITTPADLPLEAFDETIPQTGWASSSTGYQDTTSGASQITLSWYVDSRVGGWRLYRRQMTLLDTITSVGAVTPSGDFAITVNGNWEADIITGQELFAGPRVMGTVLSAVYFAATDSTSVRVRLAPGLTNSSGVWAGQVAEIGQATELARIRRTTAGGIATYVDTAVAPGQIYYYTIQAYGFFDETKLGPMSEVLYLAAGDVFAPASIQIQDKGVPITGYPQVRDKVVRVKFRTPSDADYAGVRVIYRQSVTGTVTAYTGTTLSVSVAGLTTNQVQTWTVQLTSGAANGTERTVTANTATDLTLDTAYDPLNVPVAGDTVLVYLDINVCTDYGLPDTDDELQFTPVGYGTYTFRAFDLAGNMQDVAAAESWTYDASQDTTLQVNLPPQISLQQLNATQQTAFFPANDARADATQYAVVLLSAQDPAQADPTAGVTISYQIRGGSAVAMPATTAATSGVVDNPNGTRSRYVLLTRGTADTTIAFWATDADGIPSATETYTIDYDNTPELVSVEYRDGGTDTMTFTVAVDDDTASITYWTEPAMATDNDPSAASPATIDTSSLKIVLFSITLRDGAQKVVKVTPWAGAAGTGAAGDTWIKEISRQPRTTAVFEARDQNGNASGTTVRASLMVQPARAQIASRTLAASGNTTTTLVDSGTPGWTADSMQYSVALKQYYFVEITSGSNAGLVRPVLGNSTTGLMVSPGFPSAPDGATYRLWNAATVINTDGFAVGTQTPIGTTWVVGNQLFFDRRGNALTNVTFYSVVTGVSPEAVHTVQVDQDASASISNVTVQESPAGTVVVTIGSFDDDVKYWRLYARKNTFPGTLTPAGLNYYFVRDASGRWPIDAKYLRWQDTPATSSVSFSAGGGIWYLVVIPYNAFNEDGEAAVFTLNVAGAGTSTPTLTSLAAAPKGSTETDLSWQLLNISDPSTYTVTITGQYDQGTASPLVSGLAAGGLSYAHTGIGTRAADNSSGTWHTWTYSVQLYQNGSAVGSAATVTRGDYFQGAGVTISSATATQSSGGSAHPNQLDGNSYWCGSSHINHITWTTTGSNDTTYAVDVYESGLLVASNLNPSTGAWDHVQDGWFASNTGTNRSWNYDVKLKQRSDNTVVSTATAPTLTVHGQACDTQ